MRVRRNFGMGYFGASTGGAAALRAAAALGSDNWGGGVARRPAGSGRRGIDHVKAPTLFIVGERDEEVLRLNEEAYEKLQCEKKLAVVPHATHLFQEPGALEEVARLAANWFQKHWRTRMKRNFTTAPKPANSRGKTGRLRKPTGRDRARAAARRRAGGRAGGKKIECAAGRIRRAQTRFAGPCGTGHGGDRDGRRAGIQ